jgi:hypothetical protein
VPHTIALTGASGFEMYQQLNRGTITRSHPPRPAGYGHRSPSRSRGTSRGYGSNIPNVPASATCPAAMASGRRPSPRRSPSARQTPQEGLRAFLEKAPASSRAPDAEIAVRGGVGVAHHHARASAIDVSTDTVRTAV